MKNKTIIIAVSVLIVAIVAILIVVSVNDKPDNNTSIPSSLSSSQEQGVDEIVIGGDDEPSIVIDFDTGSVIEKSDIDSSKEDNASANEVVTESSLSTTNTSSNQNSQADNSSSEESNTSSEDTSSVDPNKESMVGWTPWR